MRKKDSAVLSASVPAEEEAWKPWFRSQNRIAVPHHGIGRGKIEIPELHDVILGAFGKSKGIRIKVKEIGYESILIGGMTARISR